MSDHDLLDLDLGYADPVPPPGLAAAAARHGRAMRRRRRSGLALGAGLAVVTVAAGASVLPGLRGAADGTRPASPPGKTATAPRPATTGWAPLPGTRDLPAATGTGPGAERFTAPGYRPGVDAPGKYTWERTPVWGKAFLVGTEPSGTKTYVYSSKNAQLCIGDVEPPQTRVGPSACLLLRDLPAQGLWGVTTWNAHGATKSLDDPLIVSGLVRGGVDAVVVHTPYGDVRAQLATAGTRGLGTLFWAHTRIPMRDDHAWRVSQVVAYRDGRPVYACTGGTSCLRGISG